ncbi:MAG: hypothetical protein IKG56_05645 [Clostridia bacterium]|nr:hypothetical protein [Clostridia bacterium]
MKDILNFLYMMNSEEKNISDNVIIEAYKEILNINNKEKSNIFINSLFTYLILKRKDSKLITKLLKISFEKDGFVPYIENAKSRNNNPIILLAGSGKKGIKTINVSTTAAIVATSLGANIIKPCSMATSSISGSFDFLNSIGVNTKLSINDTRYLLKRTGFGIFPIEKLIPKFDTIYGDVFYAPNILSYALAALICPIKPEIVLYGLANNGVEISGEVLEQFNVKQYRIVSSNTNNLYYMDELNIFGESTVYDSYDKNKKVYKFSEKLKLPSYTSDDIKQSTNVIDNIKKSLCVLEGKNTGAYEELIALNAGNILQLSGICDTIEEGYAMAKEEIKTGKCIEHLRKIIIEGNGSIDKFERIIKER